jgi:hypothetical protein
MCATDPTCSAPVGKYHTSTIAENSPQQQFEGTKKRMIAAIAL